MWPKERAWSSEQDEVTYTSVTLVTASTGRLATVAWIQIATALKLSTVTEQKSLWRNLRALQSSRVWSHQQQRGLAPSATSKGTHARPAQIPEYARFLMNRLVTDLKTFVQQARSRMRRSCCSSSPVPPVPPRGGGLLSHHVGVLDAFRRSSQRFAAVKLAPPSPTVAARLLPSMSITLFFSFSFFFFFKKAGEMSATRIGVAFLWGGWRCPKPQNRVVGDGCGGIYRTQLASRDVSEDVRRTQVGDACGCQQRDDLVSFASDKSGKGIMT
ncbi:hypothetical protein EYF80_026509 [Liparis tanakae]|uniref:Uncharacterized protein n=1 Tax=Liparis tanakae TaxID=230148 RepID=A0A4Z2HBL2_9TELE|nr:hypothetical protein EYF80_026509 [Liparis tanakae]